VVNQLEEAQIEDAAVGEVHKIVEVLSTKEAATGQQDTVDRNRYNNQLRRSTEAPA
jgi:hypothetical protein